ncbi:hypothetical protein L1887_01718 [Cichorium endivia]|nr:hypothetical protein L1887_01718 [Cichorium endivia]
MSHKLADAATMLNLVDHWATVNRRGTPKNPHFISSSTSNNIQVPKFDVIDVKEKDKVNYGTRIFEFSNSKVNELKNKVIAMGKPEMNPTRVEALIALLFKHAVSAAKTKSSSSEPSNLSITVNLRKKFADKCPDTAAGNLFTLAITKMAESGEMKLNELIAEVRKGKMELEGIRDEQEAVQKLTPENVCVV